VERVADHAVKISEAALALDIAVARPAAEEITARAEDSTQIFERAVRSFVDQDTELANDVLEERKRSEELFSITRKTTSEKHSEAASSISIALDSLLRIREYGFNIAESALDAPAARRPAE